MQQKKSGIPPEIKFGVKKKHSEKNFGPKATKENWIFSRGGATLLFVSFSKFELFLGNWSWDWLLA